MRKILTSFLLFLVSIHQGFALNSDAMQSMQLMADKIKFNNKQKVGNYIGHVYLKQGTSLLRSNTAWTYTNNKNQLEKAIALGSDIKQALFETLMEGQKDKLKGSADKITYFPNKQWVRLEGNAQLTQGKNKYKAPVIIYDITKQRIISKKIANKRTHITIEEKIA